MNTANKTHKAPFPYFGGKTRIAAQVWSALGDVSHYIEPFCGSCAVLLARPDWDTQRHTETVNDADGHIANVWRSLQADPEAVAKVCDWPVNHADLIARKRALNAATGTLLESLCADEHFCDATLAGYYIWSASCWIGNGLIRPGKRPHLANKGKGVHAAGKRPHLADKGKGVHAAGKRPHLTDSGADVRDPYNTNIYVWFRRLAERLRYVRVVCGNWSRVCGGDWQDATWPTVGMFFDPPYSDVADRDPGVYAVDSQDVAHEVREWCKERGKRENYRIVLAGYYDEHSDLLDHGWTCEQWSANGGYANTAKGASRGKTNCHRETLFFSPYCITNSLETLFDNTVSGRNEDGPIVVDNVEGPAQKPCESSMPASPARRA